VKQYLSIYRPISLFIHHSSV